MMKLGKEVKSLHSGTVYSIVINDDGYSCTCPDFRHRRGSYSMVIDGKSFSACKHILKVVVEHKKELEIGTISYNKRK